MSKSLADLDASVARLQVAAAALIALAKPAPVDVSPQVDAVDAVSQSLEDAAVPSA